jgi:hypothetical protein
MEITDEQRQYLKAVNRRVKRADAAVLSRLIGVQVAWIVSLIAGAGVALVQAIGAQVDWLGPNADWISALLGFLVVLAQGADRLVARTSGVVRAEEDMRRNLAREQRLFHARSGPYRTTDDPFHVFVQRAEVELATHDREVAAYSVSLLQSSD